MKYLQASFSIEKPARVFGCEACIYGPKHGYQHTRGFGCELRPDWMREQEKQPDFNGVSLAKALDRADLQPGRVRRPSSLMRMFKGC